MLRRIAFVFSAFLSVLALLSCAGTSSVSSGREQDLVNRAIDAQGGVQALSGINTTNIKATIKQWEPEQSDVPGGPMRFANEGTYEVTQDRVARAVRVDWVKNFAYPAPRTFTFSEIVTPDAGYVIGVDSNGRNAQSLQANPPAHAMSGYRLATSQRESLRGTADKKRGVLAKALKPLQDAKTDMPVVGVQTVKNAAAVFLAGIAVEAGAALILDKAAVAAEADRLGLFVIGMKP